ncbi:MAG: aminotransferase class V-fold PLP-dependent enzyme [Bryobacterales bacterium]|nr:aminotransferase class V-fold PLP-dependent enzyme [Bryobacterales bacterium]
MNRRKLLGLGAGVYAALQSDAIQKIQAATKTLGSVSAQEAARDEDFWFHVRHAFTVDRTFINLNNGGVCPSPRPVQEAARHYQEFGDMGPSHHMWRTLTPNLEPVRRELARTFGSHPEEIAITRNASEALEIGILGLDLKAGDEVVTTNQDYPRMLTTWDQRVRREGIVVKQAKFPVPPPGMDYLYKIIEEQITPRTKVISLCHITNRTGQIFPIKRICDMARQRGIFTIIDGAHAFAHWPYTVDELGCDAYGSSLHKWMTAPIGTGFLYVKRDRIKDIWPLMAATHRQSDDIRKFEEIGTHPAANRNAIAEAVIFHHSIGGDRKAARLRYLRARWSDRLRKYPQMKLLTSDDPEQSCGIGVFDVEGMELNKVAAHLYDKWRIVTTMSGTANEYRCIRITPNVYTTLQDIDTFGDAMEEILAKGLPA